MGSTVPHTQLFTLPVTALATAASFSDFLPFLLPPAEVHLAPLCQSSQSAWRALSHADGQMKELWSLEQLLRPLLCYCSLPPVLEHKRHEEHHQGGTRPSGGRRRDR